MQIRISATRVVLALASTFVTTLAIACGHSPNAPTTRQVDALAAVAGGGSTVAASRTHPFGDLATISHGATIGGRVSSTIGPPRNLVFSTSREADGTTTVSLFWDPPDFLLETPRDYVIERLTGGRFVEQGRSGGPQRTAINVRDVPVGVYTVRVRAV